MTTPHDDLPPLDRKDRRARLLDALGDGLLVLRAPALRVHANDVEAPHRPNADVHYLTGFPEPDAVVLFDGSATRERFVLFVQPRDPEHETWTGPRAGVEGAVERFGADAAYPVSELDTRLSERIAQGGALHYSLGRDHEFDRRLLALATSGWERRLRNQSGRARSILDPRPLIHEMRLRKSDAEIEWLRRSAAIGAAAHCRAMAATRPGGWEHEIEALLDYEFRRAGTRGWAYPSIVAGGVHATVLHYTANDGRLDGADLLLVDAGCDLDLYCSDITRTWPIGREPSRLQQRVHTAVLESQLAGIAAVRPGGTIEEVHHRALEVLCEHLLSLGCVQGTVESVISAGTYKPFYMHRTSHWLGLDVHDVGAYEIDGQPRPLEPGMVLTVEPGLYFGAGATNAPPGLAGIGVRIEDDVVVTATGCEVLTAAAPKDLDSMLSLREAS